jgi:hypothetical protein
MLHYVQTSKDEKEFSLKNHEGSRKQGLTIWTKSTSPTI